MVATRRVLGGLLSEHAAWFTLRMEPNYAALAAAADTSSRARLARLEAKAETGLTARELTDLKNLRARYTR